MIRLEKQTAKEINTGIADRMSLLRKRRGLSQKDLAAKSGVSLGSLKRFEQEGRDLTSLPDKTSDCSGGGRRAVSFVFRDSAIIHRGGYSWTGLSSYLFCTMSVWLGHWRYIKTGLRHLNIIRIGWLMGFPSARFHCLWRRDFSCQKWNR